jgi:hypothetical protein
MSLPEALRRAIARGAAKLQERLGPVTALKGLGNQ